MDRPNILFMLADDMGWGDVSCHGSPIRTPNIDRLMDEGVELTQHYVCPVCTPTRTCLMTGRTPGRIGAHATVPSNAPVLSDGYETLATTLRAGGYETGIFGKWHLGSAPEVGPNHFGFDYAYGSLAGGVDPYNHFYKRGPYCETWRRNGARVDEIGHVTDLIAREAVQWIEGREGPWFCYVPFTAVHVPIKPTQQWLNAYSFETFDGDPARDRSFKQYAAYSSHMDEAVGKLTESLSRLCQRENTIVIFSSDNGATLGTGIESQSQYPGWQEAYPRLGSNGPFRGHKGQLYEGGVRTPMVVSWRGHLTPGVMDSPAHMVDWAPTFTNLTGCPPAADPRWDGVDIWPLITGEGAAPSDRAMYWNFRRGSERAARVGEWKLIQRDQEDQPPLELFNIEDDPYEQRELAADMPDKVRELSDVIEDQRQLDDTSKRDDVEDPRVT